MKSVSGRKLIRELLSNVEGRYVINVHDKLLALCGWFFEYIFEPVYKENPYLLYQKKFHRFVAMFSWLRMQDNESQAHLTIKQFQAYMRSRDPSDAPILFDNPPLSESEHPFEHILRFAYGYRATIIEDNSRLNTTLPQAGRWTLDLSISALWSHLNHWGEQGKKLSVICDVSKPLQDNIRNYSGDENDPGIYRVRQIDKSIKLGWKLFEPIKFGDSRNHPAIQLSDLIASTSAKIFSSEPTTELLEIGDMLKPHLLPHSILPDLEEVDLSNQAVAANALVLVEFGK